MPKILVLILTTLQIPEISIKWYFGLKMVFLFGKTKFVQLQPTQDTLDGKKKNSYRK